MSKLKRYLFAGLIGLCAIYIALPWFAMSISRWIYKIPLHYNFIQWTTLNSFTIDKIQLTSDNDQVVFHQNQFIINPFTLKLSIKIRLIEYHPSTQESYECQDLIIKMDGHQLTAMTSVVATIGSLKAQALAHWSAQYDRTQGYLGPLELELPEQNLLGLKIPEQSLWFMLSTQSIQGHSSLHSQDNGAVLLDVLCNWKTDTLSILSKIQKLNTRSFSGLGDHLVADLHGMLSVKGSLFNPEHREGSLKISFSEGRLINFNPQKATRFINPIQQFYELPSLFFETEDIEDFIFKNGGLFANLKNNQINIDRIEFIRSPKHYVVIKGDYKIAQDSFNIRLRYAYPGNPLGLSFKLIGTGDKIEIQLQPGDLLKLVPMFIIPNIL